MVEIPHLSDGSPALLMNLAHLPTGELEENIRRLMSHDLSKGTGAPAQSPALADLELDVVNPCAPGDLLQRFGIPHPDLRLRPRHHLIPYRKAVRGKDIAFLSIPIMEEGNPG
jgi:hypothetical protein